MSIKISKIVALACFSLMACRPQSVESRRNQGTTAGVVISNSGISLKFLEVKADAYDYTFASQMLELKKLQTSGSDTISSTRMAFVGSKTELAAEQKDALNKLCQGLGLSSEAEKFTELTSLPASGNVYVQWRSHTSPDSKRMLSSLISLIKAPVRCLMKIQIGDAAAQQLGYIVFDPIPDELQSLVGTGRLAEAVEEVVMLIEENSPISLEQGQVLEISSAPVITPMIPALHPADLAIQLASTSGNNCRYHLLDGKTKVGNPAELHNYQYGIKGTKAFSPQKIVAQSIGGREIAACGKLKPQFVEQNLAVDVSCGDYRSIQDEGLEAGCQWSVDVANQLDPENAVSYTVGMPKITFDSVDVGTITGAASVIPESPRNPVRNKLADFSTFSATQLVSMEQSFDFWIAVSPKSFTTYFDNYIKKVTYLARTGQDCSVQGVLAFVVSLTATEIFWCEAAGMSATAVAVQNSPLQIMLIGVTAFHENLHTRGREHDFDALQYKPCAGTSESALLSFDTIKTCTEDFCRPLKDFAISEYKAELDYSLRGDARRFQGQCQIWNDGLGLKATDFRT